MDTNAKLKEVEGTLAAYRNGWMEYDAKDVRRLQRERIALGKQWREIVKARPADAGQRSAQEET